MLEMIQKWLLLAEGVSDLFLGFLELKGMFLDLWNSFLVLNFMGRLWVVLKLLADR